VAIFVAHPIKLFFCISTPSPEERDCTTYDDVVYTSYYGGERETEKKYSNTKQVCENLQYFLAIESDAIMHWQQQLSSSLPLPLP
jgi:hypothetical protein